ncbi:MAG: MBL fold metallo-hydrolase, partial [Planctomycetota bacterium]
AGVPQAGAFRHRGWTEPSLRRYATSIAVIDGEKQYLFDCTPDFRNQHRLLYENTGRSQIDGIFLTHAHIGHYTGLVFLGRESMGASGVPVWAMPRMRAFIEDNGPWSLLVELENIGLRDLTAGAAVRLSERVSVTPIEVPHRAEFSETVGFVIDGPSASALYLPDIDSWRELDEMGTRIEDLIARVDVAYLDATFYNGDELPGRNLSKIPHPFITTTLERLGSLPESERAKVRFVHLNHSNPAQYEGSDARRAVEAAGMRVAERRDVVALE